MKYCILLVGFLTSFIAVSQKLTLTYAIPDSADVQILENKKFTYIRKEYTNSEVLDKIDQQGKVIWSKAFNFRIYNLIEDGDQFVIERDSIIERYDQNGMLVWSRSFQVTKTGSGSSDLRIHSMVVDIQGNTYVSGSFYGEAVQLEITNVSKKGTGHYEGFLFKIDKKGNVLKGMNVSDGNYFGDGIMKITENNLYIGFNSYIGLTIKKYDLMLQEQWKIVGVGKDPYNDDVRFLLPDPSGDLIVVGEVGSDTLKFNNQSIYNSKKEVNSSAWTDLFVLKIKSTGIIDKLSVYPINCYDGLRGNAFMDSKGNFSIAGAGAAKSLNFGSTTINNSGFGAGGDNQSFRFLVKFDNNCTPSKAIGCGKSYMTGAFDAYGNFFELRTSFAGLVNGKLVLDTFQFENKKIPSVMKPVEIVEGDTLTYKTYLIKHSADLNTSQLDSIDRLYVYEGNRYTVGNSNGIICFAHNFGLPLDDTLICVGDTIYNPTRKNRALLMRISDENFASLRENVVSTIKIYPNPSTGNFTISNAPIGAYSIVDELGKVVHHFDVKEAEDQKVQALQLSKGVYFLRGSNAHFVQEKIVVIE